MSSVRVITGDSLVTLPAFLPDTFDSCVTDPPYGLGFMGKAWDHGVPGEAYWSEVLRVLKPGAHLAAFGGTRTYHRLACAIEDAGFEIIDTLIWLYGTGKPASKTRLKPAWEPITLARKPGGIPWLNIDGCRIGNGDDRTPGGPSGKRIDSGQGYGGAWSKAVDGYERPTGGRWPSNVVLDDGAGAALDRQNGDVSRFFYCAKASKAERGEGNTHPTVKPRKLMDWLVRLVTIPGGRVLDPFCGSGTTLLACLDGGFKGTGIDNDPESVRIAYGRIRAHGVV